MYALLSNLLGYSLLRTTFHVLIYTSSFRPIYSINWSKVPSRIIISLGSMNTLQWRTVQLGLLKLSKILIDGMIASQKSLLASDSDLNLAFRQSLCTQDYDAFLMVATSRSGPAMIQRPSWRYLNLWLNKYLITYQCCRCILPPLVAMYHRRWSSAYRPSWSCATFFAGMQ